MKNEEEYQRYLAKKLKRQRREETNEINKQANEGIVTNPKVIGRFKYK